MFIATWILCLPQAPVAESRVIDAPPPVVVIDFVKDVRPLLQTACIDCHGADRQKGDVRLDLRAHVFPADPDTWLVVPGAPADSLLFEVVARAADDPERMPKDAEPLTAAQLGVLRAWIEAGAVWPDGVDAVPPPSRAPGLVLEPEQLVAREQALARLAAARVPAGALAQDSAAVEVRFAAWRGSFDANALALLDGLQPCLTHLDLAGTALDDELSRGLGAFGALRELDLARTRIGDASVAVLAQLPQLTTLNLVGTQVSDASVESLVGLRTLRRLYVWDTGLSSAAIATLRATRAELLVDCGEAATRFGELVRRSKPVPAEPEPAPAAATESPVEVAPAATPTTEPKVPAEPATKR